MDSETVRQLKTLFLFQNVSEDLLLALLSDARAEICSFKAGAVIYDEAHYRKSLGIILSGRAEVQAAVSGRTVILNRLDPPRLFGVAGLFQENGSYVTRIIALKSATILFIPEDLLTDFMRRDFALVENYLAFLSQRIRFLNRRISGFTQTGAEAKLARYLLDVAQKEGKTYFHLPATIKSIANILNLGRASLYRALDALIQYGYITRDGKNIRLLDSSGLESLCL
jgi:CRP-like cAMP-binding protein